MNRRQDGSYPRAQAWAAAVFDLTASRSSGDPRSPAARIRAEYITNSLESLGLMALANYRMSASGELAASAAQAWPVAGECAHPTAQLHYRSSKRRRTRAIDDQP